MADLQSFLSPQVTMVAIALLATFSIGGIIYALFEPQLSGRAAREKRMKSVSARSNAAVDATRRAVRDGDRRRKSVQDQLKEFEAREKKKQQRAARLSLDERIDQAGHREATENGKAGRVRHRFRRPQGQTVGTQDRVARRACRERTGTEDCQKSAVGRGPQG